MMELTLDSGLLGEFDYHGDTIELGDIQKPTIMKDFFDFLKFLGGGIGAFIMLIIGITFLGSCMGCDSCISCLDDCSMCESCQCGSACYECGKECRSGCGCTKDCGSCGSCGDDDDDEPSHSSSSSSGCGSIKTKNEVYHIVYENGETVDLCYETKKQGCSVVEEGFTNLYAIIRDPDFFTNEGIYKDKKYKKMVISPEGEILKSLDNGDTYYAKSKELYVGEERKINIVLDDGSIYPIDVTVGSEINTIAMPPIPTKEGYVFVGGFCGGRKVINRDRQLIDPVFHLYNYGSTDQVLNVELEYELAERNVKVYINSNEYTVTVNHGSTLQDVVNIAYDYVKGNLMSNQKFIGWSSTNKESELISKESLAETKVTDDNIKLYAIIKTTLNITLNYSYDGKTDKYGIVPGTLSNLPTPDFIVTGYKFVGWCRDQSLTDPFMQINYDGTSSITLYAKWEPETYTIQYYSSVTDRVLTSPTYTYSELYSTALIDYNDDWTPNGYEFRGWSMKDANVTDADLIKELPAGTSGNITIYAIYRSKPFNITIDEGYGNPPSDKTKQVEYGKTFYLPPLTIDEPSMEFVGYYYNNIQVTDKNGNSLIPFTETALGISYSNLNNIKFTAKFDVKKFTVKFYYGNTSEPMDTKEVTYGDLVSKPNEDPTMKGYQFDGWSRQAGNYVPYDFTKPVISSLALYTHFTAKTYTVHLVIKDTDAGIATLSKTDYEITYDQSYQLDVPVTDEAYNFMGYKLNNLYVTDSTGKSKGSFNTHNLSCNIEEIEALEGLTFTAEFEMKTFSVNYQDDETTITKIVNYGDPAENLECKNIPTGYDFIGWTMTKETNDLYDFTNSSITDNLNLYAVYKPMSFTLTLKINPTFGAYGVSETTTVTIDYDSIDYQLPLPEMKPEYVFLGYKYEYGGIDVTDASRILKKFDRKAFGNITVEEMKSLTLTAQCKMKEYTVTYFYNGQKMDEKPVSYGDSAVAINGPTELEVGYHFVGWTDVQGSTELYEFNTILTDNLTLYAVVSNQYTVTLYDSDQSTVLYSFTVTYGSTWTITYDQVPSMWLGWHLMDDTDKKVADKYGNPEPEYASFNFTENISLYIKL